MGAWFSSFGGGVGELIINAGPMAKLVLLILLCFSIVCWAVIFEKWRQLRLAHQETERFLKMYREGRRLAFLAGAAKKLRASPAARVFLGAHQELLGRGFPDGVDVVEEWEESLPSERLEAVNRAMRRVATSEIGRLERHLPFLATTASSAPFIGLFGTVWGVMAAFQNIGSQGSASLAVVAPGISEALIATAAGLAAAIPAVIAYNHFVNRVKHWAGEMENFSLELLNQLDRPIKGARPAGKDGL